MKAFTLVLLSIIVLSLLAACANTGAENTASPAIAIGKISQQTLLSKYGTFKESYQAFTLSDSDIALVKSWPSNVRVDVYFGSWCHDSQREVPRFLKLAEQNTQVSYQLIGVDYDKLEPSGSAQNHNIKHTATFVIYQNNEEIGRIVERPTVSLVADISAMLKVDYKRFINKKKALN